MNAPFNLPALSASPCGGLKLRVAGAPVLLRPSGALWLEAFKVLAVADLHLEKGSSYAARGQLLPPYDTAATLTRLEKEAKALQPQRIVLMGDSFHDGAGVQRLSDADRGRIETLAQSYSLIWLTGNHDAEGLHQLPGVEVSDLTLGALILRHEPEAGDQPGEVAGHLHPCAKVAMAGRSVRRRCFATDGQRLILPAFGAYAGGLNLLDAAYGPLFKTPPLACALGADRVHPLKWDMLKPD
jgi:DNA ligase-associated metallophosphoesterase